MPAAGALGPPSGRAQCLNLSGGVGPGCQIDGARLTVAYSWAGGVWTGSAAAAFAACSYQPAREV